MENIIKTNSFAVTDMPGMNTVAFVVEKNENEYMKGNALLTLQKLEPIKQEEEGKNKKVFNVIKTNEDEKNLMVLVTLTDSKAVISTGELSNQGFSSSTQPLPLQFGSIYNMYDTEYKEVEYLPNLKRHFSIIDIKTGEELKPTIYRDESTGALKGICKILPQRPYIVIELKFDINGGNAKVASNQIVAQGEKLENILSSGSIYVGEKELNIKEKNEVAVNEINENNDLIL